MSTQETGGQPQGASVQDARAQAKADKAYRKAMRPWFKKKRFVIPIALVAVTALSVAVGGGDQPSSTVAGSAGAGQQPASAGQQQAKGGQQAVGESGDVKIGVPVRDGAFEFTVGKPKDEGASIGSGMTKVNAQGKFIVIPVDVTNIGDQAKTLEATSQKLIDSKGREFNTSHEFFALPDANKAFLENINPGNTVKQAPLLFDVPKDVELATLELHDSMFSGGVKVSLK